MHLSYKRIFLLELSVERVPLPMAIVAGTVTRSEIVSVSSSLSVRVHTLIGLCLFLAFQITDQLRQLPAIGCFRDSF